MPKLDDFEPSGLSSYGQNVVENQRGVLGSGLVSGYESLKGLGYSTGAALADVTGADEAKAWLEKQAKEKEYQSFVASRPELERVEDQTLGSALPYAGYQVAKQIPNVVGAIGMGMLAPEAAVPAALSRAGAVLPRALGGGGLEAGASIAARRAAAEAGQTFGRQIVGGAAFNEAQAVGSLYQSAREGGDENAGRTALLASPAYALAETLPEAMLVGRVAHGSGFTGNLLQRSLKAGATQGAAGATSEIAQTGMEQAVGKELTPEERKSQFLNAGVAGGLVEGILGLPGGFRSRAPTPTAAGQAPAQAPTNDIAQTFQANDTVAPDTRMAGLLGRAADPLAGRSTMYGGELPVIPPAKAPITAPAVTGGTTDVAQAATGVTQAQYAEQQRQQQDEANRIARLKTFQTLGAQYSPENTGQLNIFGATLFDDAKINAFGNTLAAKFNALPETAHTVADAIAQANELTGGKVINVKLDAGNPVGSADKIMKALAKAADSFQIGHVANTQQAATILETLSRTEKGAKLDQLNAIHYALTGEDTTGFLEAQQAEATKANKGAKNAKLPVQTTTGLGTVPVEGGTTEAISGGDGGVRPTEVQPVGAASVGEGPLGLQVGQPPTGGVRTSAGNVPNAVSGETPSSQVSEAPSEANQVAKPKAKLGVPVRVKAPSKQGAPSVQPTPAPAPKAEQREEAKLSPAEELWNDMDATDTPYASLTPALKQAWERAVETKQATGAIQEEIADQAGDRAQETKADGLIAGVLQMVIRPYGRLDEVSAQKKREFFQAFWGGAKLDSLADIAEDMEISIDQARKWHAELPNFLEKNSAKIIAAAASVAESQGMTMRDLEQLLEGIEAKRQKKASTAAQVTGEEEETGQGTSATEEPVESDTTGEDEFAVDEMTSEGGRDEGPTAEAEAEAASDTNIRTRKSISIQERYNAIETNNARILKTMEALEKAKEAVEAGKTPKTPVEELEARLAVEMDYAKQLYDRNKLKGEYAADFEQTKEEIAKDEKRLASEAAKKLRGTKNAVQVESTNEGNVRQPAGGGEEVGQANAEPKKPTRARKAKVEAKPVEEVKEVKTDAERAAEAWDAVVKDIPGAPPFMALTPDEQETFIEYGEENWTRADVVAELNKLGPQATEEAKDAGEQTAAAQVEKLTEGQTVRLEKHYGVKRDSKDFLAKLNEDVVRYVNKGAEAVAAAIRDIVKAVSEGVLAVALVFNPNANLDVFKYDAQQIIQQTVEVREEVPATAQAKMSQLAKDVYSRVAPAAKKTGKGFIIADKPNGMIHVFANSGEIIAQDPALFGKDKGDVMTGEKITPAGKFNLKAQKWEDYAGGYTLDLWTQDNQFEGVAVHAAYLAHPEERRIERLASPTAADNKISGGCINTGHDTFLKKILPNLNKLDGGMLFVLPDVTENTAKLFPAETKVVSKGVPTGKTELQARTVTGKEEKMLFGKDGSVSTPYSVTGLSKEIAKFVRTSINTRRLKIVDSVGDLLLSDDPVEIELGAALALNRAYGVAANGRAYLIANRINKGEGRAKFLHEVGVHLGMEGLLTDAQFDNLTDQIFAWAKRDDDSRESQLAKRAILRADLAETPDEDLRSEILAYFVEEASQSGIEPSAAMKLSGPLGQWFRTLYAAFKLAIRRLGMNPEKLTAQDVVNMAYGAARLEMSGTYHGTAAEFRRFNHMYMGSGEGAQAYGWGSYLAQSFGVAKGYWQADVRRKTVPERDLQVVPADGKPFNKDEKQALSLIEIGGLYTNNWASKLQDVLNRTTESIAEAQSSLDAVRAGLRASRLPAWRYEQEIARLEKVKRGAESLLTPGRAEYGKTTGYAPEGNVMRVDIGVSKHQLLNWDTVLNTQPEVLKKIEAGMPESVRERLEDEMNVQLDELTGEELYRALQALEKQDGLISDQFSDVEDYNKRLANKGSKRIVSAYLDEVLGVPGLKFLDQNSRGDVTAAEAKLANKEQLLKEKERTAQTDRAHADKWDAEYTNAPAQYKEQARATWLSAVERATSSEFQAELLRQEIEDDKKRIAKLKNPTQNLVIFNDKNIFRVGSQVGAQRNRMRFGISNLPKPIQPTTQTVVDTLLNSGKDALINRNEDVKHILLAAGITEDVVNGATKYMPSAQDYLNNQYERQGTRIEHEQRIQKIEEAFEKLPTELQGTGRGSVNEFIFDSTSDSKWGYVPSYNPNIKPDAEMARRFDAMPDAAQRVIKMVFEHGYQSLRLKQKAVKAAADKEFSQRELDANGDQEQLNNIAAERSAWESKFDRLMNIKNDMPYAYLGRYGDYVAVAKSETFADAEKLAAQGDLDATKWLEQNQSDANHYIVEFAETMAEAQNKAEQWKASGRYQQVYGAEKEVSEAFVGGSDLFMGITRLRNMLTRRIKSGEITLADQEVLTALNKTVSDLYLATVSEASAHRTAMQRKNISGADKDMMRNLATRGRADAHFLASLKHNEDITDAISNMRDEAKADPTNARPYLNELLKRYANDINYKTPAPLARALTRLGHTWFLSFNPAFYLQQMTQTYVLSLPYMAGRLGYHRSLRSINAAYKDVVSLVKDTNVNEHLDFSKAPADVRDMLLKLVRMGKIDIGIDADAVVYANERTLTSSVMRKLNGVNNRIEAVNRATAAVAAYRGYLQRYGANNTEAATKFAAETVSNTHGSYDGFNTPRILNSNVGKVVGQFKRFQIIQLSMLGKLIKNAFKGASAEERMVARQSLKYITAHMAVLGGALGVPFVSQIGNLLVGLFGDDDEPKDLEYKLRQAIGDPTLANLLLRGAPSAVGLETLGKKLAMENVASILPFTDVDLTSRSGAEKMLVGLMGPTAALGLKFADALGLVMQGELYKGMEQALPTGFANAMKGYRYATEGITLRNGDVVLSPEEVSMVDAAFQAVGLPTNTITQRQYRQNVEKEFDKFYSTKATEIKGAYVNANRDGDTAGMAEARQAWQDLQDSRAKNGYTKQPVSELFKAIMAARKREASAVGGVETTKANKGFVKNII